MSDPRTQLIGVLAEATSQHPDRVKLAEQHLKQWETERDFHATLQDIFYDRSLDLSIRWISGIYLKNGMDRYWRRGAKNAIVPEEKALIRRRLLTPFDEERKELSVTNAVLTSKIARLDFPQEWPDLLQSLLTVIQTTTASADSNAHSRLVQVRALYTLHMVVKALCSQRLAPSRRHLEQVSPELFRQIATIYVGHVDRFLAGLQNSSDLALVLSQMEVSVVCLKCIRRLMVHGFDDFSKVEETRQFFTLTLVHLQRFYALRPAFLDTPIATPLDSHIIKLGKLYLDLQKYHPLPFVLAPRATDVVAFYWGVLAEEGNRVGARLTTEQPLHPPLFERFLVHGLLLLKNTIKNFSYTAEKGASPEEASTVSRARQVIDQSLLTPGFVNSCAEVLVSRYMVLRPEDLEAWETDPEGFVGGEEADHWEFELRPCAEKVFMDLLSQYRVQLSPILLNLLENVATITDHAGLLFKDAVYCAIGLGAHELFDSLDFDAFLVKRLTVEAWNKDPSLKILRRRIAWIIGKWVGVKISKSARPDVYRVMLRLMSAEEDTVVRLTAVNNLKNCVDDWDFEATPFAPFLKEAVYGIIGMLGDVSEFDSRMRILNSLSMIIERVEEQIAPYAQQIVELLPSLWNTSESEHLFKSAILVTLTKLVGSLKERSSNLQNFVVPLIQHSVDHNQEAHLYLMDDALDLWWTAVQSATHCSEPLYALVPAAVALLEYGTENLRRLLKILESYVLLAPVMVMQNYATPIMDAFTRLLGNLKPQACTAIVHVIDTALQASPLRLSGEVMANTGLLWKLLTDVLDNREQAFILTQYLGVFARIVIYDPAFFLGFIEAAGQRCDPPQLNLLSLVLEKWFDKFDNVGHPRQRKLNCMAFTALTATANPLVLVRLPQVMAVWSDVLSEVKESGGGE
ncbi:armadillo-type protein [Jimgerdemannia flammicorona]|uniref:Armadillo-type protein n=1 Tax=Jimgerdemannia flammicorona TaxID=994334 RepID=A0A433CW87_9FUNG|nr:armadillo-type protein [Jimgerdemannia flammicorona]